MPVQPCPIRLEVIGYGDLEFVAPVSDYGLRYVSKWSVLGSAVVHTGPGY
jgi:hypothetical protein